MKKGTTRSRTLEEVGKGSTVTRELIRQIEAKTIRELCHSCHRLKDYLEQIEKAPSIFFLTVLIALLRGR